MSDFSHEIDGLVYTIVHPETDEEVLLHIEPAGDGNRRLILGSLDRCYMDAVIGQQQLGELGSLFLTLAGQGCDFSSAFELLDGYNISADHLMENAHRILRENDE